jgi:hypothetical protein
VAWKYLHVLSAGPLIIVRVPDPMPPWRAGVLKACTGLMREHGLHQKDISSIEGGDLADMAEELDRAFAGGTAVPKFWLYEYRAGSFVLCRSALEKLTPSP